MQSNWSWNKIKKRRRLRREWNTTRNPETKTEINKLKKEIEMDINKENAKKFEKICKETENKNGKNHGML